VEYSHSRDSTKPYTTVGVAARLIPVYIDLTMSDDMNVYDDATIAQAYEEALDDVHTRFLLNLPPEELASTNRIFFQLEQAWWFYDDFHCDHSDIPLPRFKGVRAFALVMFKLSPLLKPMLDQFDTLWDEFSKYKRNISTYGTILLNASCTKLVLCQVWNGKAWTFPAGKVNQNESGIDAGARETYEETGFDPNCNLGLTKDIKAELAAGHNLPWNPLEQDNGLVFVDDGKRRTCYVCRGVPEDFVFAPVARKEVSAVEWHDLDDLPKRSFAVLPFLSQLRRWIRENTKSSSSSKSKKSSSSQSTPRRRRPKSTTPNKQRRAESARSNPRSCRNNNSRGRKAVREDDPLTETGLAFAGDDDGWDEDAMFTANERILGRKITYDGNPHYFAEKGFDGKQDPHAFHVVGGSFMNSGGAGITKLAPPPEKSRLQPLFCKEDNTENGLQPFFSEDGEAPCGEVVLSDDALRRAGRRARRRARRQVSSDSGPAQRGSAGDDDDDDTPAPKMTKTKKEEATGAEMALDEAGRALLKILQNGCQSDDDVDDVFMTDAAITARSQKEKLVVALEEVDPLVERKQKRQQARAKETADSLKQRVKDLPQVPATFQFGDFRFDVDAIMNAMDLGVKS
jgi:mRNA-decapping enzyme subunit 2